MDKRALAERFGALVQRLRLERGLSQDAFAHACRLERAHVGKIERGEVNVTVATTLKLIDGLGLTLSGFFAELESELEDAVGGEPGPTESSGTT
jgi:transcriptional regulator with XRE-family HTH domain